MSLTVPSVDLGRPTLSGDEFDWPTNDEFEAAWNTVDAYKALKSSRVEMVLRRIELASRRSKSEPMLLTSKLTVEHVMPQGWEAHWPLPSGSTRPRRERTAKRSSTTSAT